MIFYFLIRGAELDLARKNPDSRRNEERVDKPHKSQKEEGVDVAKTSVEETRVIDQKSENLGQENVGREMVDAGVAQATRSGFSVNVRGHSFFP